MSESLLLEPRTWTVSATVNQIGDDLLTASGENELVLNHNYNTVSITLTTATRDLDQFIVSVKPHKNSGDALGLEGVIPFIGATYWSQPVRSAADGTLTFLFKDIADISLLTAGNSGTVVFQCGPCYSIRLSAATAGAVPPPSLTSLVTARVAAWRM